MNYPFSLKYGIFLAPIAIVMPTYAADYLTEVQAQKVLFSEADEFIQNSVTLTNEQISKIQSLAGVRQRIQQPRIWKALKKGRSLGTFVIDEVIGKHEYITYAVAISPEETVLGIEIMSYRETHGGEVREANWRKNFKGKKLSDPFKLDVDVPNITGATLSSRNILDGVKRVLVLLQVVENGKTL